MKKNISAYLFILIFLLAAIIRLYSAGTYVDLDADEKFDTIMANRIIDGEVVLLGNRIDNLGSDDSYYFRHGPLYFYIVAFALWVGGGKVAVLIALFELFNLAGILLLYRMIRRYFNPRIALFAAGLHSLFPILLMGTDRQSRDQLVVTFLILIFYSLLKIVVEKKSVYLILLIALWGMVVQIHFVVALTFVPVFICWLIFRPSIKIKHFLAGVLCFILLHSTFIYYELTNDFKNIRICFSTVEEDEKKVDQVMRHQRLLSFLYNFYIPDQLTHLNQTYYSVYPNYVYSLLSTQKKNLAISLHKWINLLEIVIILAGMLLMLYSLACFLAKKVMARGKSTEPLPSETKTRRQVESIMFIWGLFFVFFLLFQDMAAITKTYYYNLLHPVPFLLAGIFLDWLLGLNSLKNGKNSRDFNAGLTNFKNISIYAIFILITFVQVIFNFHIFSSKVYFGHGDTAFYRYYVNGEDNEGVKKFRIKKWPHLREYNLGYYVLKELIFYNRQLPEAYFLMGHWHEKEKFYSKAIEYYQKAQKKGYRKKALLENHLEFCHDNLPQQKPESEPKFEFMF